MATISLDEFAMDKEKKRKYRAVKIDAKVVMKAEVVVSALEADGRRTSVAEYLSGLLAGPVTRDFERALKQLSQED